MINPYEFLGLTVESSPDALRKAYYTMSLSCHPDKGGSQEAMVVLQAAYRYIKDQFDNIRDQPDAGKSYEALQEEFDNYIKSQDAMKPPSFLKVVAESLDIKPSDYMEIYYQVAPKLPDSIMYDVMICTLNEIIRKKELHEKDILRNITKEEVLDAIRIDLLNYNNKNDTSMYHASIPGGYGGLMDSSDPANEVAEAIVPPKNIFDKKDMIIYHEPDSVCSYTIGGTGDLPIPQEKDDYSLYSNSKSLPITDYKRAYGGENLDTASSIFESMCSPESIDIRLATQKLRRDILDDITRSPEIVKIND